MSGFTSTPYDWVRQIPAELKQMDEIPLWGNSPNFSWENFSIILQEALKLDSCAITPINTEWREALDILHRINENPFSLTYALNPLKGHAYLLFANSELEKLLGLLLHSTETIPLLEKDFIQGFSHFLGLELADAFQKTGYENSFIPQILSQNELPDAPCLCVDIKAAIDGKELHGMLCISSELRTSIKEYYLKKERAPNQLYDRLEITLQLVAGKTIITKNEWNKAQTGDFLILDSCSIEPGADKSRIMLTLNDLPIFRGKIKDGSIKILEYPQLHEVQTSMSPKDYDDEESDFDEGTDSDFDDSEEFSEEEHTEDEYSDTNHYDEDEDEDEEYSDEESYEEESEGEFEEESEPEESEFEESEIDEDEAEEEEEEISNLKTSTEKEPVHAAPLKEKREGISQPKSSAMKPEDIPLTISVEVGRLQMTIQKLSELEPGNLLELNVHPENGVDLVVNGKCIGKGELLRIGDILGVRILDKA